MKINIDKKRLETFVFEFDNQEVFKKFWGEYCHLDKELNNGITWKGVATGDKLKEEDKLLELIGKLYDIGVGKSIPFQVENQTFLDVEKLLGIK